MSRGEIPLGAASVLLGATLGFATIFGGARGIVHDPHHRPIEGAEVTIRARASAWSQTTRTDAEGAFAFSAVPVGEYRVTVNAAGFTSMESSIVVTSGSAPILHFPLQLEVVTQRVQVSAAPERVNPESSTTASLVSRDEITRTPGADRTNSLAMVTDFVPGATLVHNQIHLRGGHQGSWLVDGVPVPNTSIASNVGPQFDPKDIDYLELQRGGYSAEYGDRIFGVFNVVPRSGFERNNEAEVISSFGSFNTTDDQISLGSHTERFAYYASASGNRSDLGLQTPTAGVLHDLGSGLGAFASLIFNVEPKDQLRLVTSLRSDHFQIPNTPEQEATGIRDIDREHDAFANFSWVHSAPPGLLLTVSPFYHFNGAAYVGGQGDRPLIPEDNRASHYLGGQVTLAATAKKHNARAGVVAFAEHDNTVFGLRATDNSEFALRQQERLWGNLEVLFLEDQYKLTSWLTLNGGVRLTRFSGPLTETAASPRLGAAIRLPRLNWVLRGNYGRYYQSPPQDTVSGPLLEFALHRGFSFLPLRGERDEQHEVGLTIPLSGWVVDLDHFRTGARNFFDHDVLGNSNIFLPLTLVRARLRGWEATVRSPRLFRHTQVRLAYAHQFAEAQGGATGGLIDFKPPENGGYYFLDHDQRDTLSAGLETDLPRESWAAGNLSYGSGFLNGDGPGHLPAHTTVDLSLGKRFGENWSLQVSALNLTNGRYLLDTSNTFGGTHYAYPRQLALELRYRFRY